MGARGEAQETFFRQLCGRNPAFVILSRSQALSDGSYLPAVDVLLPPRAPAALVYTSHCSNSTL